LSICFDVTTATSLKDGAISLSMIYTYWSTMSIFPGKNTQPSQTYPISTSESETYLQAIPF